MKKMKERTVISFTLVLLLFAQASCKLSEETPDGDNAPTGLTIRALSPTTIYLSWTGITNAEKYTVYRITDAGTQQFDVYGAYDYTDTGLAYDTLYSYQVSATKGGVESTKSRTVSQKTPPDGTPPTPSQVGSISTSVSGSNVTITWSEEARASSYTLERGESASGPWTPIYQGSLKTHEDENLEAGTWYYHVAASNASGMGPFSTSRAAVVIAGSNPDPNLPSAPTATPGNLTVTNTTKDTVSLSWDAVEGAASYKVYRGDTEGGTYTETSAGTFSGTTFTNTGLSPNTDYWYKVAAANTVGVGPLSPARKATTLPDQIPPTGIPGNLIVTGTTRDTVSLSWDAVEGATSYKVYRSDTEGGTYTETSTGTFSGTTFTNTGLSLNTTYWYKVAAANAAGTGPLSLVPKEARPSDNGTIPAQYNTLALKLAYIGAQFDNGTSYDITVDADEYLPATNVGTMGKNVTINLHSPAAGNIKTVSLSSSTGYLFTVSSNITLKLTNIKIQGSAGNDVALLRIGSGGTLVLDTGAEITGNTNTTYAGKGGGIFVDGGTVTMLGGKISGNILSASYGCGGGILVEAKGKFTMHGGTIGGNKSERDRGGGAFIAAGGYFAKTALTTGGPSGVIYGNDAGEDLANSSRNAGHAVYYNDGGKKRDTTLGGFDEISTENVNIGWEE